MSIDKPALRASARALRDHLSNTKPGAANALAERFPAKLLDRFGPCVSGYLPIGSELDPRPLMERLKALGAELCLPRVEADDSMRFHHFDVEQALEKGPFDLLQPAQNAPIVHPTLVLTPLLAFDAKGNRLGYGKGHYDRALAKLRENGRVFVCGLAYAEQEVIQIPAEETDIPLDWMVTPEGSIPLFLSRGA